MADPEKPKAVQQPGMKPADSKPVDPRIPVPQRPQTPPSMQEQPDVRASQAKAAVQAAASATAKPAQVVKHVWTSEDTYSSLAFKYYGSIKEPFWRLIYNHNKAIIGDQPNDIRVGLEIEIPPLPDELENK